MLFIYLAINFRILWSNGMIRLWIVLFYISSNSIFVQPFMQLNMDHIPMVHQCIKAQQLKSLEKSILSWKYHILNMITFMSYCMQQIQPKTTDLEFHFSFQWCIYIFFVGNLTLLSSSSLYPFDLFIFLSTSLSPCIYIFTSLSTSLHLFFSQSPIKKKLYILSLSLSFIPNIICWKFSAMDK